MGCNTSKNAVIASTKSQMAVKVLDKYKKGITKQSKYNETNGERPVNDSTTDAHMDERFPLSQRQIFAITRSWKAIERNMTTTSVNMFIRLFETNSELKQMFTALESVDKISDMRRNQHLEDHALMVMCTLDEAISNLDDLDYVQELLKKVGKSHRKFPNYTSAVFSTIEEPFMLAIKETLGDRCNVSLELTYRRTIKFIIKSLADGFD